MCCWPDYWTAEQTIELYKQNIGSPDIDLPEAEFKSHCDKLWAADDLLRFLNNGWFDDYPIELIADYIDDCRYRAKKYQDCDMGKTYEIARQTAEEIMEFFI